jgi:hypothetical protein
LYFQINQNQIDPQQLDPQQIVQQQLDPQRLDPQQIVQQQLDPQQLDPQQLDPQQLDPQQLDPQQLDPQQIDPQQIDPQQIDQQIVQQQLDPQQLNIQLIEQKEFPAKIFISKLIHSTYLTKGKNQIDLILKTFSEYIYPHLPQQIEIFCPNSVDDGMKMLGLDDQLFDLIDVCVNECTLFVNEHIYDLKCSICSTNRYDNNKKPFLQYRNFSIRNRINLILNNSFLSKNLRYPSFPNKQQDLYDHLFWKKIRWDPADPELKLVLGLTIGKSF